MISCNIALYIYHNVEAVCAALLALGQSGGGYGGVVGDKYVGGKYGGDKYGGGAVGPPRIGPDSNGNRDSDLEDELNRELIEEAISNRDIRIGDVSEDDLDLDIEGIKLYTYREEDESIYLAFVPFSRRDEIIDKPFEALYSYSERHEGYNFEG